MVTNAAATPVASDAQTALAIKPLPAAAVH
jgi:hypothetical protein